MKIDDARHIIWSNDDIDIDEYRDALDGELTETEIFEYAYNCLEDDFDEIVGMCENVVIGKAIAIGKIGTWLGTRTGYKLMNDSNTCLSKCFESDGYSATWYVDKNGDLWLREVHHDGTNLIMFRAFKDNVESNQIDWICDKILKGTVQRRDITKVTRKIGDDVLKCIGAI